MSDIASWRDIETAPKDRLVRVRFYRTWVYDGSGETHQDWEDEGIFKPDRPRIGGTDWCNRYGQSFSWEPTHWLPL